THVSPFSQPQARPTIAVTSADRDGLHRTRGPSFERDAPVSTFLRMPRRATAVVLSLLAACSAPGGVEEPPVVTVASDEHSVVSVIDGDTIVVGSGGLEERVRLIGINAPEPEECLAEEATQALDDLVSGSPVRLVPDASDRDGFGRLLRYVYVDG